MKSNMIYKDAARSVQERVEDLLSRMSLEEKVAQLCGNLPVSIITDGKVNVEKLRDLGKNGHGRFTQYSLVGLVNPDQIAKITNEIQRFFVEETRLGIPVALQSENLCGYPAAGGTLFPAMINMGSTWEPDLAEKMSNCIGEESKAVGINSAMSPVVDVSRDPRWGRTYETFGEDQYLVSQMGIHYVRGMQSKGVSCIAKHFLGYAETQGGLNTATTRLNLRELYEVFATPFEAAAKEVGLGGMMASYSEIDGIPVGANKAIARDLLRKTMGFNGMLISDGAAIWKMYDYFHISSTYEEAGLLAKKGGLDSEIPVGAAFKALSRFVKNGQLDESLIDESVRRVLKIKFDCGLFENPYVDEKRVSDLMTTPGKQLLSMKIAEKSIILLKNEKSLLPLAPKTKIAVIGPHADSLRYPVSGYTYPAYIEMLEASENAATSGQVSFNGIIDEEKKLEEPFTFMRKMFSESDRAALHDMNTVLRKMGSTTLKEELEKEFPVRYAEGCGILSSDTSGFQEAVQAAEESDVVVMALGGNCGWVNVTGGEGKDRCHLDLPGVQQRLLETIEKTGKPVVLILYGPGIFSVPWAVRHVESLIQAWLPGPYGGKALARVISGACNPGGKLPVSVPGSVGQLPVFYNHKTGSGYTSGGDASESAIFSGGYVDEDYTPLFPFGFGMSYTTFKLSDFQIAEKKVPTNGIMHLSCVVENTGETVGDEVIQLYYHFSGAHVVRPNKQLAGFKRISLNPGESKKIRFALSSAQLGYFNEDMEFVVEPGCVELMIGTSSSDLAYRGVVELTGTSVPLLGKRVYTCTVSVGD